MKAGPSCEHASYESHEKRVERPGYQLQRQLRPLPESHEKRVERFLLARFSRVVPLENLMKRELKGKPSKGFEAGVGLESHEKRVEREEPTYP